MKVDSSGRSIKLMHVVDVLCLAGMEYGVIKVVNRLDQKCFAPSICCLRYQEEDTRPLLDGQIPVFELKKPSGRDFRVILKLASLLHRERVDLVHSHNWQTFFYTVAAATLARVPIIIHGEHGRENQVIPRRQLVLSRWLARKVTHLVTVSSDLGHQLVDHWKVKPERVWSIPNGVDLEAFGQNYDLDSLRQEFHLTPENRVVMNTGGLRPVKDQWTLLQAFGRLYQKFPEARLLIVGGDEGQGIQTDLEKLAVALKIRNVIYFTGVRHDIPKLLSLCDVYVNTSLFEGMSNTVLEAMAGRKPVVATAVGGNPELVRDGITGYLISPGSHQELAARLERLFKDPVLAHKMGSAGRAQVECDHPMSRMVHNYSDLYKEAISRNRLGRRSRIREHLKRWASQGIRLIGLSRLKEMTGSPRLTILTYHRVLPLHEARQYPFQGMVMPRDLFEDQMAYLSRHYTVLGFPEAIRLLHERRLPHRAVVVTFDDGYRDNYDYAWPIMKKYRIPATFFVVTGVLDGTTRLWWDRVAEAILELNKHGPLSQERIEGLPDLAVTILRKLDQGSRPEAIAEEIVRVMNQLSRQHREKVMATLCDSLSPSSQEHSELMLSWEQVEELQHAGMHIGGHTVTHAFLDELNEEEAWQEIHESAESLRKRLGIPISFFSYTRGRVGEKTMGLLKKAGIEAAVTTEADTNGPETDLFQLRRLDAGYCRSNRGFDPATFEVELQGWFSRLRK